MDIASRFTPTNYYIYYRVSTRAQAEDSVHGLDRQTTGCETYAENTFGIKEQLINYYCDVGSSYNLKSTLPQLQKLLREMLPRSVLMIWDTSRLGRDAISVFSFLKKIREKQCVIISVSENLIWGSKPYSDKQFYHKIVQAETESDNKSIKLKNIINKNREQKIHMGIIPFGYQIVEKKLIRNKRETEMITNLITKYKELKSYTDVANYYNELKILYRGKCWKGKTVSYLINRDFNPNKLTTQIHNCNL